MNTRRIAIVSTFTAVSIVLVLSPAKVPAPYAPFLVYQIWEVPIVLALLLYGLSVAVSISVLNTVILLVIYQGALLSGPLYNLAAVLSMLLGIYVVHRLAVKRLGNATVLAVLSTALGCLMRVAVMSVVNYFGLQYPPPIGYFMPPEAALALLPVIGVFNATVALYTVPIGYVMATAIRRRIPTVISK